MGITPSKANATPTPEQREHFADADAAVRRVREQRIDTAAIAELTRLAPLRFHDLEHNLHVEVRAEDFDGHDLRGALRHAVNRAVAHACPDSVSVSQREEVERSLWPSMHAAFVGVRCALTPRHEPMRAIGAPQDTPSPALTAPSALQQSMRAPSTTARPPQDPLSPADRGIAQRMYAWATLDPDASPVGATLQIAGSVRHCDFTLTEIASFTGRDGSRNLALWLADHYAPGFSNPPSRENLRDATVALRQILGAWNHTHPDAE